MAWVGGMEDHATINVSSCKAQNISNYNLHKISLKIRSCYVYILAPFRNSVGSGEFDGQPRTTGQLITLD